MAWIESHQELERHPKLLKFANLMGWNRYEALGRLHSFWYWCLDYAINGDLRKFNDDVLADAMGVASADAKHLIDSMVESCWIDRGPSVFRVHDWLVYVRKFLQIKYSGRPEQLKQLLQYCNNTVYSTVTDTHLTLPNLTKETLSPQREVELPPNFPQSQKEAEQHAGFIGCPVQFAADVWTKAASRGGRDAKDIEIRSFRHYLATEWKYERERLEKEKNNAKHGANNRQHIDRNKGTLNEGRASQYAGIGKV